MFEALRDSAMIPWGEELDECILPAVVNLAFEIGLLQGWNGSCVGKNLYYAHHAPFAAAHHISSTYALSMLSHPKKQEAGHSQIENTIIHQLRAQGAGQAHGRHRTSNRPHL